MKTYRIPNTDLEVSRLAFGTWHLGGSWDHEPVSQDIQDRATTLIHTAVEQGINFIDLADIYTRGKSDIVVGETFKATPSLRDKVVLQSKCGIILAEENAPGHFDFSYDNIVTSAEASLKRLNTDRMEILLLHRPDPLVEPEEVARAFDHLHSSGKVRYFGVSNHTAMQIELLKRYVDHPLVVNQLELNLLHNYLINDGILTNMPKGHTAGVTGLLDYCRLNDMTVQAWSPVAGGQIFSQADDAPNNIKRVSAEITRLAEKYNVSRSAIAFAWLLRHPAGIQPVVGTMKPERLIESCQADSVELTRIEWYRLLEAANDAPVP